jgi:hypothetical protein
MRRMNRIAQAPLWLHVAAALILCERLALFAFYSPKAAGAVSVVAVVLVMWFLLRGSKVAWVIAVAWTVTQLPAPFVYDAPAWVIGSAAVALGCLLAPQARAFVWSESGASRAPSSL